MAGAGGTKVLVTGGRGFLGRRIVERLLADGRQVCVLGRNPSPELEARGVRFIRAGLDDAAAVGAACAGVDTVFHVAAKVGYWGPYVEFFRTNVLGTRALIAGCRAHGVRRLVYTSTPSVVYSGGPISGADESLPLTANCPSPYPTTKAIAERDVLAAHAPGLATIALRPHLIWGVGDPHLVPRLLARARAGRLRIVGTGRSRVDMVHIENAVDAHLLAERALSECHVLRDIGPRPSGGPDVGGDPMKRGLSGRRDAGGRAFFVTNGEPVVLWDWINALLKGLGEPAVTKRISLGAAKTAGMLCEAAWRILPLGGEPPMTRFIATELARDHWFDITAARRDLGYVPRVGMAEGTAALLAQLLRTRA